MREGKHGGHRGHHGHRGHGHRHEEGHEHGGHGKHRFHSAQTFRRGRALAFLETLSLKRATLLQQLNQPEYEAIKPVISGELKATDAIIQQFIHAFELREMPPQEDKEPNEHIDKPTDEDGEEVTDDRNGPN
ncbi:hypothetical protein DFQ01_101377 [Paenibacillus cellulosilyticus]|uniref:Uncharacterized protein n=1 Tax=Paenibacillus cellulosilyticus TaxID=375489 RepID=A0A2V2Z1F3_9BACL|nr:hypothetical protein [Paenibacillus cellulosilyticus]PWW08652.1 hypothetical protein DFQ01_101377 [Paenibacillus cellulosilyticus]QKS48216.1 hypothetical protein HUB94_28500 [Paenibacillus cellulosilyticus]